MNDIIKKLREEQGLTQKELAERAGVSTSFISRFEKKERVGTLESIEKLLGALGYEIMIMKKF